MDAKRFLSDALYISRGFGLVQEELGGWQSRKALVGALRSASNNDKEIFGDARPNCPTNNRVCRASANLKSGTKRMGDDDDSACILSDFASAPPTLLEDCFFTQTSWGDALLPQGRYIHSIKPRLARSTISD